MISPFIDNAFDEAAYVRLIEHVLAGGVAAVVAVGTTGESPTLSNEEHERAIALAVETVSGRVPVIAGTGSNNTDEAIAMTRYAQSVGAAAALVVTPYYNKPSQAAMLAHYRALHDACNLPIIVYNVPGRTGVDLLPETIARMAELPRIVALKDASGKADRVSQQRALTGDRLAIYCGDDAATLAAAGAGAIGCISVTANIAPAACAQVQAACAAGDFVQARALHEQLMPLHEALFCDSNPVPVKYAAARLRLCQPDVRLPLLTADAAVRARVDAALQRFGLIDAA